MYFVSGKLRFCWIRVKFIFLIQTRDCQTHAQKWDFIMQQVVRHLNLLQAHTKYSQYVERINTSNCHVLDLCHHLLHSPTVSYSISGVEPKEFMAWHFWSFFHSLLCFEAHYSDGILRDGRDANLSCS